FGSIKLAVFSSGLTSSSSSRRSVTNSFLGRTCIFLKACPSCSSILNIISLKRGLLCIVSIYFFVCSFGPETVPLIPSGATRILPLSPKSLQNCNSVKLDILVCSPFLFTSYYLYLQDTNVWGFY